MNTSGKRAIWLSTYALFVVAGILLLISSIKSMSVLSGNSGNSYITALKAISIIGIIGSFFDVTFSFIGIAYVSKGRIERQTSKYLLTFLIIDCLVNLSTWIILVAVVNQYYSYKVSAIEIIQLILILLSVILFVYGSACTINRNAYLSSIVGCIALAIGTIISLAVSENNTGLTLTYMVLYLVGLIAACISLGLLTSNNENTNKVESIVSPTSEASPVQDFSNRSTTQNDDGFEKLKKLKELKDAGIITEEEYNEKRAKYIDSL